MKQLSLVLVFGFMATAIANADNSDRLKQIQGDHNKCMDQALSTREINECSAAKLEASDELLNDVYTDVTERLKRQSKIEKDVPEAGRTSAETLRRLVNAQRAWITFRDAECSLQGTDMLGGTGEGMVILSCKADMTFERVKALLERKI